MVEKPQGHVTAADLQESQQIINNRVNGLGVSNSNVTVQGNNIVIELPGAKNDTAVLKVVGQTAQLFFRPVDCIIAPYVAPADPLRPPRRPRAAPRRRSDPRRPRPRPPRRPRRPVGAVVGPVVNLAGAHLASATLPASGRDEHVPDDSSPGQPVHDDRVDRRPTTAPSTTDHEHRGGARRSVA